MATKAATKRKAPAPAQESTAFGPIAERFRRAGDHERAISLCREGLKKFPHHVSARVTLGWALLETGKYDEAREELEAVLKRAPDNLAAIRGLAELHDRAEHTLNLPMDGPGQWPPDAATLEDEKAAAEKEKEAEPAKGKAKGKAKASAAKAVAAADANAPAVIAPAELGLAMWSPVQEAEAPAQAVTEAPIQAVAEAPVYAAAPEAPIHPAQTETAAPAPAVQAPQSGMSSMRELDPNAGVVQVETAAQAAAPAPQEAAVAAEPEVDIAALIAEADKLEADAEASDGIAGSIELDAAVDLTEFADENALMAEPFEVGGNAQPAAASPVASEPAAAQAFVAAEPIAADEPEPAQAVDAVYVAEPVKIEGPGYVAEPVAVEPVVAEPVVPEPVVAEPVAAVEEPVHVAEPIAAFEAVAAAPVDPRKPQILALERFLRQVQTRRLVVAQSVA